MQALPERIREFITGKTLIADDSIQILLRQLRDVFDVVLIVFLELRANGGEIGIRGRRKKRGRRAALEPLIPHMSRAVQVRDRIAHGTETRAEIASELFVRERAAGIQQAAVCPGVVLKKKAQQFRRNHQKSSGADSKP